MYVTVKKIIHLNTEVATKCLGAHMIAINDYMDRKDLIAVERLSGIKAHIKYMEKDIQDLKEYLSV